MVKYIGVSKWCEKHSGRVTTAVLFHYQPHAQSFRSSIVNGFFTPPLVHSTIYCTTYSTDEYSVIYFTTYSTNIASTKWLKHLTVKRQLYCFNLVKKFSPELYRVR